MTERLADITARMGGMQQLGAVVNAMRGIAAARAAQARLQLSAVDRYAAIIAAAIARALALAPAAATPAAGRTLPKAALVLFCAEQGFAGAFSQRVLDAVGNDLATGTLFLVGSRGAVIAAERGARPGWTIAMPAHAPGLPKLADRIATALYAHIAAGGIGRLDAVFSHIRPGQGVKIERRRLFPLDLAAFPQDVAAGAPMVNLPPAALLDELTADYVHALLCNAALHSFAAESEARMEAMAAAHTQVERQLSSLRAMQRQVRQEEITAEIIELAAGEAASQPG